MMEETTMETTNKQRDQQLIRELLEALKRFRALHGPGNMQGDEGEIPDEIAMADAAIAMSELKTAERPQCRYCDAGYTTINGGDHWIVRSIIPARIDIRPCLRAAIAKAKGGGRE